MTLVFLCPLCQLTVAVADSAAPPAAADRVGVGWTLTKEVEVQLAFSGMYAGKMLHGKKSLKSEASHIELFGAYGITPRKYEFLDDLDGVATLPFHEVTHDKKKYLFCAAANDTTNGIAVALLFEIVPGALVEKDLTALMKGAASKDAKHAKTAAASLEVRSRGVCAWFVVRACSFSFFPSHRHSPPSFSSRRGASSRSRAARERRATRQRRRSSSPRRRRRMLLLLLLMLMLLRPPRSGSARRRSPPPSARRRRRRRRS